MNNINFEPCLITGVIAFKTLGDELTSVSLESVLTKKEKYFYRRNRFSDVLFGRHMGEKVSEEKFKKLREDSRTVYAMRYIVIDRDRNSTEYIVSKKEFKRINRIISSFRKRGQK